MRQPLFAFTLIAAIAQSASPASAFDDRITDADVVRLASFDQTRADALAQARSGGSPEDVAALDAITLAPELPIDDFDLSGTWQCRTIKAGGAVPLVVYGWFRCSITDDGSGWWLEKVTGSQRTAGQFFTESDRREVYLGSYYTAGETPPPYGSGPESDQAGYMARTGDAAFRIEFPAPTYESLLDILEFRR